MSEDGDLVLMTRVAREYYIEGRTRIEIASDLGISRFKTARLLETARRLGVVKITIQPHGLVDSDVSARLRDHFGLREVLAVLTDSTNPDELYGQLGLAVARHLAQTVTRDDVLGFDTGRTVGRIADHLEKLPPCDVLQLAGLAGTVQLNGMEILRRVVDVSHGTAYPLYAPMIALDAATAAAYRQQPEVLTTMQHYRKLTKAIISVGSWQPPVSQVYDRLAAPERDALRAAGAVAETCALMFDRDGRPLSGLNDRRIGISLAELAHVPNVIAVGGGPDKATAIHALLRSRIVSTLATDVATARLILTNDTSPAQPPEIAEG